MQVGNNIERKRSIPYVLIVKIYYQIEYTILFKYFFNEIVRLYFKCWYKCGIINIRCFSKKYENKT